MAAIFFADHCVPTVVVNDLQQAGYEVIPHIMSRLADFLAQARKDPTLLISLQTEVLGDSRRTRQNQNSLIYKTCAQPLAGFAHVRWDEADCGHRLLDTLR